MSRYTYYQLMRLATPKNVVQWLIALTLVAWIGGCVRPTMYSPLAQRRVARDVVEFPANTELRVIAEGLNAPVGMTFDQDNSLIVAESGEDGEARIYGWKPDQTYFDIFPTYEPKTIPEMINRFRIFGRVGGIVAYQGKLYLSHRDRRGYGVITELGYDRTHKTLVGDLPAMGDFGMTDLVIGPDGRLYFGVGSATNSGVVGIDNAWTKQFPLFCDLPFRDAPLYGFRFDTPNPQAGLTGPDVLVTAPFHCFGSSDKSIVRKVTNGKPTGAIYSVLLTGGDFRVHAHGIRWPRGLGINEFGRLYMTNDGMEMRGTRPVKDDPDALLYVPPNTWFGFPNFSTNLQLISEPKFQPPIELSKKTGYDGVRPVFDHEAAGLVQPDPNTLLQATLTPLSGAAKFDFIPNSGPFKQYRGMAIAALSGDRAPFATSNYKLSQSPGYKVVLVDLDTHQVKDFIYNSHPGPISNLPVKMDGLERPVDVKVGPDGAIYILDFGKVDYRSGRPRIVPNTGKIFKLTVVPPSSTSTPSAGAR